MDISEVSNAKLAKALTPNEEGQDRPAMRDVTDTMKELKAMPEKDADELREWYAAEFA